MKRYLQNVLMLLVFVLGAAACAGSDSSVEHSFTGDPLPLDRELTVTWSAPAQFDGELFRIWLESGDGSTESAHDVIIETRERTFTVMVPSALQDGYIGSIGQLSGPSADSCPATGGARFAPDDDNLVLTIDGDACSGG